MGDVVDDFVGAVEDVADVVVDVVETVTAPVSSVVDTVVSPIADAVSQIPIVGDVVEMAAPFGGMLGTFIGGPIGGAIGNAVGDAFGDGGGGFDILDTAIGMFGGDLPGPIADIAGGLFNGGSLIDTATSVFGGDIGGIAQNLLGGDLPGLGDLGGMAQNLLGGEGGGIPGLGDLGGIAQNLLGGNMPDIGDLGGIAGQVLGDNMPDLGDFGPFGGIVGQVLGGGGMPDLADIGGLDGLIKTADSVFGGLGLGNLGSAASGIMGDVAGGGSDGGGWLGDILDNVPGVGAGVDLPFGLGSLPSIGELTGPISQSGGSWMDFIQDQSEMITDCFPSPIFETIEDYVIGAAQPHLPEVGGIFGDIINEALNDPGVIRDPFQSIRPTDVVEPPMMTDRDNDLDDLVFNLPGVDRDGPARDALQQLADTGNLGEALASLSQDDLTTLVTRLVAPAASPVIDTIVENAATSGQALDDLGLPASIADQVQQAADDMLGDDLVTAGADAALGGPDTVGITDSTLPGDVADTALGGQDDFDADLGLGLDSGADGGFAQPEPAAMDTFTPEPVESDFSQEIAQADAVEDSFDSMFDDLGGTGQG